VERNVSFYEPVCACHTLEVNILSKKTLRYCAGFAEW